MTAKKMSDLVCAFCGCALPLHGRPPIVAMPVCRKIRCVRKKKATYAQRRRDRAKAAKQGSPLVSATIPA